MKTLKYSDMLKQVINLYPREIPCHDAHPINEEEFDWDSLSDIFEKIVENNSQYFEEKNDIFNVLLMSTFFGIIKGFRKQYVKNNKPCTKVPFIEIIDLDETKKEFLAALDDEDWQEYLKERGEEVIYDEITRDMLQESLKNESAK